MFFRSRARTCQTTDHLFMGQAGSSSSAVGPSRPPHLVKMNDSVYEVYRPQQQDHNNNMDIVFFHGLQMTDSREAHWRTWTSMTEDGYAFWPREWLAKKFPQSRMLSTSYDAFAFLSATSGRQDLFAIGECLLADLVFLVGLGQDKPVVFVGHSLGGLVIKQVILEAYRQSNVLPNDDSNRRKLLNFLSNIKGIFYFSTPHLGSQLSDLVSGCKGLSPVMQKISGQDSERLNEAFRKWRKNRKHEVKAFSVCETQQTTSLRGWFRKQSSLIVPEWSARYDTDGYLAVNGDHFEVVQPKSPVASSFQALTRFISVVTEVPVCTFEIDAFMIATGMPVQKLEGFPSRTCNGNSRSLGPDEVTGIPVKNHQGFGGNGLYVRVDVPEDPPAFFEHYADAWQRDVARNYAREPLPRAPDETFTD